MSAKPRSLNRLVQHDGILRVTRMHLSLSLSIFTGHLQRLAHWVESQQHCRGPTSTCEPNGGKG